jgi:hypothetical protein
LLVAKETGYASIQQYLDARLAPVAEAEREKAVAAMHGVR